MRTYIYIDGFNLYYGALKGTPYKWLNVAELCRQLLHPKHDIQAIKYFTAYVHPRPHDPGQLVRQQTYLRAL
ncbi:MAG: NYN domain-containing protein, partial [Candidatus Tectomicrobia bacterium]|nr:NYN domain-containing protein [Candidatus Tectomicrobia bacterium]